MIFLRGLLLGLAIAAPVGPIGILCIRRTLAYGRLIGFITGLGAATADMAYAAISAFGLTAIAVLITRWSLEIHLIGAIFLLYLGLSTIFTRTSLPGNPDKTHLIAANGGDAAEASPEQSTQPPVQIRSMRSRDDPSHNAAAFPGLSKWGAYGSTVALTLTNPATILSFTVIFAGLGLVDGTHRAGAASIGGTSTAIVFGVFCGSALWWFLLSGGIAVFRARITSSAFHWINRASGAILVGFAVLALVSIR